MAVVRSSFPAVTPSQGSGAPSSEDPRKGHFTGAQAASSQGRRSESFGCRAQILWHHEEEVHS